MTHVATLISNPLAPAVDDAALADAKTVVAARNAPRWLAPGIAADLSFTPACEASNRAIADRLKAALAGRCIDVVVQEVTHRRKRLLVADMDSTMIGQECLDELADKIGLKSQVAPITQQAMQGKIAFEVALRARLALLKGLPVVRISEVLAERIQPTPGAATLVATMRANGAYTCLVSGGFTLFSDPIARRLGFDEHRANRLGLTGAQLSGRVEDPVLGPSAKCAALTELRTRLGLGRTETLAIGDGANDLLMLAAAGLGIAYHAQPKVIAAAQAHIDHGDLTALLYAQGYARTEFVTARQAGAD